MKSYDLNQSIKQKKRASKKQNGNSSQNEMKGKITSMMIVSVAGDIVLKSTCFDWELDNISSNISKVHSLSSFCLM